MKNIKTRNQLFEKETTINDELIDMVGSLDLDSTQLEDIYLQVIGTKPPHKFTNDDVVTLSDEIAELDSDTAYKIAKEYGYTGHVKPKPNKMTQEDWDEREEQDAFDREANESLNESALSASEFAAGFFRNLEKSMSKDRWTFKYTADDDHPIELEVTNDFGETATFMCTGYKNSGGEKRFLH